MLCAFAFLMPSGFWTFSSNLCRLAINSFSRLALLVGMIFESINNYPVFIHVRKKSENDDEIDYKLTPDNVSV